MTTQDRVAKLEALLDRVRRNAGKPRTVARVAAAPAAPPLVKASPAPEPRPVSRPLAAPEPSQPDAPTLPPVRPPVPVPAPAWSAEPSSAVQSRPATLPPEELSDDDLLDVTTLPPAPSAAQAEAEAPPEISVSESAETDLEEEQAPVSSRRSKVAETLDEALASAAQMEQDDEREIPVKTPPPESGPQEALAPLPPGIEAPGVPDVDELEADMLGSVSMGPTAEQLGETIELEPPRGPELEIDVAVSAASEAPEPPPEELEITLPRAPMPSGTYDVEEVGSPMAVEVTGSPDVIEPRVDVPIAPVAAAPSQEMAPERTVRAPHGATDVARVVLAPSASPRNFVELLDISLGL